jgi:serine/threonine-protein kinase RsbW
MATVEVTFTPLPAHVRTARLVATAVARRSGVDESLLDEVRLAVGEACSRAVEAHRKHCPTQPIRVALSDSSERFEVVVTDAAPPDLTAADTAYSPVLPVEHPGGTSPSASAASPASAASQGSPARDASGPAAASSNGTSGHTVPESGPEAGAASAGGNGHAHGAATLAAGPDGTISQLPADVGLAVISGLADDVRIMPAREGTSIAMSWKRRADSA